MNQNLTIICKYYTLFFGTETEVPELFVSCVNPLHPQIIDARSSTVQCQPAAGSVLDKSADYQEVSDDGGIPGRPCLPSAIKQACPAMNLKVVKTRY